MEQNQRRFSIWYFVAAFVVLLAVESFVMGAITENLTYNEFKALLRAGKVTEVTLTDKVITGRLRQEGLEGVLPNEKISEIRRFGGGEQRFVVVRVDDPALVRELEEAKVRFAGRLQSTWVTALLSWVLPALVFVGIWMFFMKRMGAASGLVSLGKSKAKVYMEKQTGVTFQDVAGIDEARAELMEIVDFLKTPDRYKRLGGKIPKGVLLAGAPGTGKTLLAKAVAGEAGVPFFSMSGSEFVEMFVGMGAARVRDLFAQAQQKAPCIIFIDELDALGKARGMNPMGGHDEREQTLNQLLVEMDGFETNKGVIIMAATNRPEILDPALLRPGRFDRQVVLDRPDLKGREKILQVHTKNVSMGPDVNLVEIAARTAGFVGADLANLVNEAALRAARRGSEKVAMQDFDEAAERVVAGLERKSRVMNPVEKETVAYHEAGHALVAESRPNADRVSKVSIIPRGVAALGYTLQTPTEDRYLMRRAELLDRIDVLLGGRVAEESVFGDISTGAQNDLQRVTDLARHMVTQYGMSETLGLVTFEEPRTNPFLNVSGMGRAREYSEKTAQAIDDEVCTIVANARERVRETLTARRAALDAMAKLLLEKEAIDRKDLEALLAQYPA
ncbi:MAG: ATP-dependent metallopeptidase FtsH/Yme1/Tma family protein [Zetaproteobacteria bacterium]|nr:MAG: ATP-dependent metallopeptidase FtsH/Yme1/Tma family protein [Zetaproteobacteria bacterium]